MRAHCWLSIGARPLRSLSRGGASAAQDFGAAFSGFNSGSDTPIQIEADRLEVRDAEKLAIYSGHVRVLQGDTLLEAPELRVFYTGEAAAGGARQTASPARRCRGSRPVPASRCAPATRWRAATGRSSTWTSDLVTMSGNVVLTQGQNVVRGERLVVNLTTKEGRIEGGRVQTLITPSGGAPGGQ